MSNMEYTFRYPDISELRKKYDKKINNLECDLKIITDLQKKWNIEIFDSTIKKLKSIIVSDFRYRQSYIDEWKKNGIECILYSFMVGVDFGFNNPDQHENLKFISDLQSNYLPNEIQKSLIDIIDVYFHGFFEVISFEVEGGNFSEVYLFELIELIKNQLLKDCFRIFKEGESLYFYDKEMIEKLYAIDENEDYFLQIIKEKDDFMRFIGLESKIMMGMLSLNEKNKISEWGNLPTHFWGIQHEELFFNAACHFTKNNPLGFSKDHFLKKSDKLRYSKLPELPQPFSQDVIRILSRLLGL